MKMIQTFEHILERYESDKDRKILAPHYIALLDPNKYKLSLKNNELDSRNRKWVDKNQTKVLKTLQELYFFKRFKLKRLLEFMDLMEIEIIPKTNALFFSPDKVYIIVSGSILMRNHQKCAD